MLLCHTGLFHLTFLTAALERLGLHSVLSLHSHNNKQERQLERVRELAKDIHEVMSA
jgi:hypothetical protein